MSLKEEDASAGVAVHREPRAPRPARGPVYDVCLLLSRLGGLALLAFIVYMLVTRGK